MKTNTRSVPLDMLSVGDGNVDITIHSFHQSIMVNLIESGCETALTMSFSEFHDILKKAVNEKQGKES
jgi:hypothetical protein